VRIVAGEFYRTFLRIRATLDRPTPKYQVRVPLAPSVDSDSFLLNHKFAHACSDHILQQQALYPWAGCGDLEMIGLSFRAGAEWSLRNQNSSACNEVRHS
jgi:hypothetical protein